MHISPEDGNLLLAQVRAGEVNLILGAGVHQGSSNRRNKPISGSVDLAIRLAKEIGEQYNGEDLSTVVAAFKEMAGDAALHKILIDEYRFTKPSNTLLSLFQYTWGKVYTWNVDDSLELASGRAAQRIHIYNGLRSKVESVPKFENLPLVMLHGYVKELDAGVIFTREEYANLLQSGSHEWYRELSADYIRATNIFIGTSLNEPIFDAEVQRAAAILGGQHGRSFIVTPDATTNIQRNALKQRGLIHVQAKLDEFVNWLSDNIGETNPPKKILEKQGFSRAAELRFSPDEVSAAHSLYPQKLNDLKAKFNSLSSFEKSKRGREFLNGFGASWLTAASPIPVRLHQQDDLKKFITESINARYPIVAIHGQAGSGKTTAAMIACLEICHELDFDLFEVSNDIDSLRAAFNFLEKLSDKRKVVFISNLGSFSQAIADDLPDAARANATIVTTIRSSEWKDRFERYLVGETSIFKFERFDKTDHEPLLERLRTYVPAPKFIKLKPAEQFKKLEKSKSQLLMALREATESRRFDEVIIDEYEHIPDQDAKTLLIICGIATLARVGIDRGAANEIYSRLASKPFEASLQALEGIVRTNSDKRLMARHELYVRTILDRAIDPDELFNRIGDILGYFTRFDIPVIKHAGRADSTLFKFILNFRFLLERGKAVGEPSKGLEVFQRFEVPFQLDGHFWLQYGLLTRNLGDKKSATRLLEKSIEAFPDNAFAIHALAHSQLIEAADRINYDAETRRLINEAQSALTKLMEEPKLRIDQYPVVTLSNFHIEALLFHHRFDEAKKYAAGYFEALSSLEKQSVSEEITDAKFRLMKFITTGVWNPASPEK